MTKATDLETQLRQLRLSKPTAPTNLSSTVLAEIGLIDQYTAVETPLGMGYVAWNKAGVAALMVMQDAQEFEAYFRQRFDRRLLPATAATVNERLLTKVQAALAGEKVNLSFDLRGLTDFERAVLTKARQIPRGEIRPYSWIAREIEHPQAVRAVGSALGHNPIPLLIPCHRVVRSDGRIGNYLFGSESKRSMLELEGVDTRQVENFADRGVRFYGSDTTGIFCYPTCRHARRTTDAHRLVFASEADARAAGYRPCKICRPA